MSAYTELFKRQVELLKAEGLFDGWRRAMKIIDTNRDGKVSFKEIDDYANRHMHSLTAVDIDKCVEADRSNRLPNAKTNNCIENLKAIGETRFIKEMQNDYIRYAQNNINTPLSAMQMAFISVAGRMEMGRINAYLISQRVTPFDENYVSDFVISANRSAKKSQHH